MSHTLAKGLKNKNHFAKYPKLSGLTIKSTFSNFTENNTATIELNSLFKMIRIRYSGDIEVVNIYPSMYVSHTKGSIVLMNMNKIELENDVLFEYRGSIKINRCAVYGWGQNLVLAKIENENSGLIKDDNNIVSSYDDIFNKKSIAKSTELNKERSVYMKKKDLQKSYQMLVRKAGKNGL